MRFIQVETFPQWRDHARALLAQQVAPDQVQWSSQADQPSLFGGQSEADKPIPSPPIHWQVSVPKSFLELAPQVACHREGKRWSLLYRVLWRLAHNERHLMQVSTDDDMHALRRMQKEVSRDVHKMKAFVRFRKVDSSGAEAESYIAWHRPDHRIVRLAAPFFSRRFKGIHWSILTPDESVTWDQCQLRYGPGVPASEAPNEDALEELWKTYYASIFNPARVKVAMMKREMPVRHWPTLPEAELIADLLHQAPARQDEMIDKQEGFARTAAHYMPDTWTLPTLAAAAKTCQACDLCHQATQVVFGQGTADAKLVLIGEQPGDHEDLQGKPFVGPSGQLLDEVFGQLGIVRNQIYLTNTVKHFKFTKSVSAKDQRRLHKKPGWREVFACRPWLEAELSLIEPQVVVCLGSTPAQALLGRDFRISRSRGKWFATPYCSRTLATWHPAAILRIPDEVLREQRHQQFIGDLRMAAAAAKCLNA